MDDEQILALYRNRDEQAIEESIRRYGNYCRTVAGNILSSAEDVEEVVADTWMRVWETIPPQRPKHLRLYLAKITRNLAVSTYREQTAQKRGGDSITLALDELAECVGTHADPEQRYEEMILVQIIQTFLRSIPQRERMIFVRRYFFLEKAGQIAERFGLREDNVLVILSRTRKKMKAYLIKEGYSP